jgi:hypothetical protein
MNPATLKKDMALRLELTLEIQERVEKRLESEKDQLVQTNQQLDLELKKLTAIHTKLAAENILESEHQLITRDLTNKMSGMDSELKGFKKKYDALRDQSSKVKSEHAEFKRMDPAGLKKKLDESKNKLKAKTQTVTDMTRDKAILNKVVLKLKRELDSFITLSEASSTEYLYESPCTFYQVIGTVFKSETHPFVVNGMNFRVVDQRSGASYVAQWVDNSVTFEENIEFPIDVIEYIQDGISASIVETE